jgi:hypothetical protein
MGRTEIPDLKLITSEPWLDTACFIESEMAHSSECRDFYARKVLDTADIVRDAIYQQLTRPQGIYFGLRECSLEGQHDDEAVSRDYNGGCLAPVGEIAVPYNRSALSAEQGPVDWLQQETSH